MSSGYKLIGKDLANYFPRYEIIPDVSFNNIAIDNDVPLTISKNWAGNTQYIVCPTIEYLFGTSTRYNISYWSHLLVTNKHAAYCNVHIHFTTVPSANTWINITCVIFYKQTVITAVSPSIPSYQQNGGTFLTETFPQFMIHNDQNNITANATVNLPSFNETVTNKTSNTNYINFGSFEWVDGYYTPGIQQLMFYPPGYSTTTFNSYLRINDPGTSGWNVTFNLLTMTIYYPTNITNKSNGITTQSGSSGSLLSSNNIYLNSIPDLTYNSHDTILTKTFPICEYFTCLLSNKTSNMTIVCKLYKNTLSITTYKVIVSYWYNTLNLVNPNNNVYNIFEGSSSADTLVISNKTAASVHINFFKGNGDIWQGGINVMIVYNN